MDIQTNNKKRDEFTIEDKGSASKAFIQTDISREFRNKPSKQNYKQYFSKSVLILIFQHI